jgi:hypothetical protein
LKKQQKERRMSQDTVTTVRKSEVQAIDLFSRENWSPRSPRNTLSIARTDIEFFNIAPGLAAIELKVTNDSDSPSAPCTLELQAAPFGAFVPWQPLTALALPTLEPGMTRYVRWRAPVVQTQALGSPDRLGPRDLLTAFGLADEPPDERAAAEPQSRSQAVPAAALSPVTSAGLPPGLMDLLMQETPHWAGNINVLVNGTDVERHRMQKLRVRAGRVNLAWFIVGAPGLANAYAFRVSGIGPDWKALLFDMTSRERLTIGVGAQDAIAPGQWIDTHGSNVMLLALHVPRSCQAAAVTVHVVQRSSEREAVVEFGLDPRAPGRGCYTV